jgi:Tol biopolymer transport system component
MRRTRQLLPLSGLFVLVTAAIVSCATIETRELPVPENVFGTVEESERFGEIAYVGVDRRIYLTNRSGDRSMRLTDVPDLPTTELLFDLPTWSPSGDQLAFMGFDSTSDGDGRSTIYVADFAQRRMDASYVSLENSPFYLAWEPTGERVSFISATEDGSQLELQLVSPDGRDYESVLTGRPMYFSWSPRGRFVAVHTGGDAVEGGRGNKVSVLDMANRRRPVEQLIEDEAGFFQAPSFSPAGRRVAAAVEDEEGNRRLNVYASDGDRLATVSPLNEFVAFDWSPTGEQIAFIDGYNSPFGGVIGRFRLIDLTGSATTVGMNVQDQEAPITSAAAFFWSPDGSKIAVLETLPQPGSNEVSRYYLTLSIIDAETRQVRRVGPFVPTASFASQVVPFFDQYQRSTTPWAPDSSALVISAISPEETPAIYLIDLSDEQPQFSKVADGRLAFWRPDPVTARGSE